MEIEFKAGQDKRVTRVTTEIFFELVFLNQGKQIKSFLRSEREKKLA